MTEDWLARWAKGRTGWHEEDGNAGLKAHWPSIESNGNRRSRVLVPLCGKTPDLLWLADQGHEVVGIELSEIAIEQLFAEHDLAYRLEEGEYLDRYRAVEIPLTLYCGDYFCFEDEPFDALFDRGALVALPEALRTAYAEHTRNLLRPGATKMIITLEYDQSITPGPPFAVSAEELAVAWSDLRRVAEYDDIDNCPPKFRAAGLTEILEVVWLST
ncbi:MAG: thiopurine S-methyltransferase [Woeseiaceae bacterium]